MQVDREKLRELCDTHYFEGTLISGTGEHLPPEECPGCAITALLSLLDQAEARAEKLAKCDCVPAVLSSKSCLKCGRKSVITQEHFLRVGALAEQTEGAEARVRELKDALRELAGMNWTGVAEVEEASAWVRSKAQAALEARPR